MESLKNDLKNLPYWDSLSQEEKELILQNATRHSARKGELLSTCTDDCRGMIYIVSGTLRVLLISEEGKEVSLFYLHDNDYCVFSASCAITQISFETITMAQDDSELIIIPQHCVARLMEENIYVRCHIYELMMKRFSQVMWTMQQFLFFKMDKRLASFFLDEYKRSKKAEISMTHEEIAEHINSAREVVSRMVKHFETEGIVCIKRGKILLLDINALINIVE